MSARFARIAVLVVASLAWTGSAHADWLSNIVEGVKEFGRSVARDTKRRNCWPEPFTGPDRYAVRSPMAVMVENGWQRQNLVGDYHFVDQGSALTEAARLKIRWILTEAPEQHRIVYVQRALDPEVTAARVDNVQQLAAQMTPNGELPMVVETTVASQGWAASQADMIGRKFDASTPDPRLPQGDSGGSGGP